MTIFGRHLSHSARPTLVGTLLALALVNVAPPTISGAVVPLIAQSAPLPHDASTVPQAILNSVTCTAKGYCVAVGRYLSSSQSRALIDTEVHGVWLRTQTIKMPVNAYHGANGTLFSVSCSSPGNCVAVGQYQNRKSTGNPTNIVVNGPLIVAEKNGVWGTGIMAPQPAGAQNSSVTSLNSVSCPKFNNCVAVGEMKTAQSNKAFTVRQKNGKWGDALIVKLPNWAKPNFITQLDGVSCVAVGFCVAVGQYVNKSPSRQTLVVTETKGVWGVGHTIPLPTSVRNPWAGLFSVKCLKWGLCMAVGVVQSPPDGGQGLIAMEYKGKWKTGILAPLPKGLPKTASSSDQLASISCTSFGFCNAVGQYTQGLFDQGVTITETKGKWARGTVVPRPAGAVAPPYVGLGGVSCTSPGACVMVGQYQANVGDLALIVTH